MTNSNPTEPQECQCACHLTFDQAFQKGNVNWKRGDCEHCSSTCMDCGNPGMTGEHCSNEKRKVYAEKTMNAIEDDLKKPAEPKIIEGQGMKANCVFTDMETGKHPWTALVTRIVNGESWRQCMNKDCGWVDVQEIKTQTRRDTIAEAIETVNKVAISDQPNGTSEHAFDAWVSAKVQCLEALQALNETKE